MSARARDRLAREDVDLPHLRLVETVADAAHVDDPRADVHACDLGVPVRSISQAAAMRVPLPDISARERSGLTIATWTSSPSTRSISTAPSVPARSTPLESPSTTR